MTSARRNPQPKIPSDLLIGIIIALAVTVIPSIVRHSLDKHLYESGIESYKMANCNAAVEQFNQIISAFRLTDSGNYASRAEEKKAECRFFEDGVKLQKEGKYESALLSYSKVAVYNDSALLAPTREKLSELFQKAKVESLATENVCNRIGILNSSNLLPKQNSNLPLLYPTCGKIYEANKRYEQAISIYNQFLHSFPDHPLKLDIQRSLARTTVADIKGRGARKTKPLLRTGTTVDGSTVVDIQNTSPAKMEITFSGTTPKFGEIEICTDCIEYISKGPEICPGKGPIERYTLEPGKYDIAVKFTTRSGNLAYPWTATWSLEQGGEYKTCFVIVQDLVDESNKKEKEEQNSL
ncbi:hypothetical protein NIES4071_106280 (plasmid) [Calothrix sp. NIES-4071]|nr:hypothetical protein NIES4071_106280 [Calothrix sp. NIES-4071]BAZ65046.1 hypothetical protein NIES4105_107790 [Calothrix sp. NIES-4105]